MKYYLFFLDTYTYRFASDSLWPYWSMNIRDRQAITTQINVVCHQKNLLTRLDDINFINREFSKGYNSSYIKCFSTRIKNIQGTNSYWYQHCQNLISAMDKFGSPTIFFTLSAADYHWIDLQKFMPWDPEIINQGYHKLTISQKKKMVVENPHIATWFFTTKLKLLFKTLIPVLGISNWWARIESQGRGSDHAHGAIWLANAPDLAELSFFVKLGFIAQKKIDILFDNAVLPDISRNKYWFKDKSYLFTLKERNDNILMIQTIQNEFINKLNKSIIEQQKSKENSLQRYAFSLFFNFFKQRYIFSLFFNFYKQIYI